MAKISKMTIGISRTYNLGDYESIKLEHSVEVVLPNEEEGPTKEDINAVREWALDEIYFSFESLWKEYRGRAKFMSNSVRKED